MPYSTENIRNLVLLGQQGSGKTSLVEAILYHTGAVNKPGNVTEGNTVCDYDWLEKERDVGTCTNYFCVSILHFCAFVSFVIVHFRYFD